MKKILILLVVASIRFVAVGCDPAPKDEPNVATPNVKSTKTADKVATEPTTAKTAP